ncbi:PP2C family protein-serine/threonine phosphatase [Methanobrevibacter sp.]
MNDKVKKIIIPFILMIVFNLGSYYFVNGRNFAEGLSPHTGIFLISGLLLGPYGAIGSTIGNFLCNIIRGYNPIMSVISSLIGFTISYLGYKLWYRTSKSRNKITNPKLNNTHNMALFLAIVIICGILYSILLGKLIYLFYPKTISIHVIIEIRLLLTFINASFIFGIIGIWISNKKNFFHIPKVSKDRINKRFYDITSILLILSIILTLLIDYTTPLTIRTATAEIIAISILVVMNIKRPVTNPVVISNAKSVSEDVMNIFHLTILFIVILGIIISYDHYLINAIDDLLPLNKNEVILSMMALIDTLLIIFIIPSMGVLRYIEKKVIEPILSFSKIDEFIHENEKIESEGLIDIYSEYINEETEIGTLASSYTDLINFNNHYIENIREIEGDKERIKAELDIATRIQAANLPTESLANDHYIVNGYSKPAKEVGGDFFDYYKLDGDNLVIVIGDASGKGVPAAILAMTTQVMIKQMLKYNTDPSKILYSLNNQLCENNTESMFITLWLGIYSETTKKLTFSNAGHEPPLLKENGEFKSLAIDSGLVLGIMEDFNYIKEEIVLSDEIVLYTDGITDANNNMNEMYGADKLQSFFNEFKSNDDPINPLLDSINEFCRDAEQFDDMTLLYLKIKEDDALL